ncbi:MAG: hypothetical protein KGI40_09295 [Xanthomonadaceae bacterium]|nr:hypothetical protein [Xanthomonadaceae bacterium]MDE2177492.1 hypothetical protein [Xanthomonadaceae bacterium]MDE2245496.1 hypothetical protein [Xanthomonadaceae bacterium]
MPRLHQQTGSAHAGVTARTGALGAACVLLAACATTTPPRPAAPSLSGIARYEPVSRPDEARYQLQSGQTSNAPAATRWSDPVYPPALVALNLPTQVLLVKLVIDTEGHVAQVLADAGSPDTRGPHAAAFLQAIRTAVQDWRFDPLRIVTWKDRGADRMRVSTRTLPYSLEYRFTFSIVDGKGTASSGRSR